MNDESSQLDEATDERELLHVRQIVCKGYRRRDRLYEFEGSLHDSKAHDAALPFKEVPAGEAVHAMRMTLVLDENLLIRDIKGSTGTAPTPYCYEIDSAYAALKGLSIAKGFRANALARIGGEHGCTHLTDLLWSLATTAIQTTATLNYDATRQLREKDPTALVDKSHWVIGTCHAYRREGEAVRIMGWQPAANAKGPAGNRS